MRRFLIFTWGLPWKRYPPRKEEDFLWSRISYSFADNKNMEKLSRTTLPIFLERFCQEGIEECVIIVIVLDTVYPKVSNGHLPERYEEITSTIKKAYEDFINCYSEHFSPKTSLHIIVAPGVGKFQHSDNRDAFFDGKLLDYYYYVLYQLATIISGNIDAHEDVEIILDISHGVNYMPVLTYMTVKDIAQVISIGKRRVRLVVYNSEPVLRGTRASRIHRVEASEVLFEPITEKLTSNVVRPNTKDASEICRDVNNKFKNLISKYKLNAFLGSIRNCLPLVLLNTVPTDDCLSEIKKALDSAAMAFTKNVKVCLGDNVLTVVRKLSFDKKFEIFVKTYLIGKLIGVVWNGEPTLRDLREVIENIFKKWHPLHHLATIELNNVYNIINERLRSEDVSFCKDWKHLGELFKSECIMLDIKESKERRHFIAHAGLLKHITQFKCEQTNEGGLDDNKIKLRYDPEYGEKVYKYSSEGLLDV